MNKNISFMKTLNKRGSSIDLAEPLYGCQPYQNAFKSVLDKHAPVKNRQPRKNPLPCVNSELRGAIYRKHMFYSQYTKNTVAYMCQLHVKRVYMMYIIKHCNKNSYTGSLSTVKTMF
jgi:tRNA 2-selenouridine synthase SelU